MNFELNNNSKVACTILINSYFFLPVVEGPVLDAKFGEELEGGPQSAAGVSHSVGAVVPRPLQGGEAERISTYGDVHTV